MKKFKDYLNEENLNTDDVSGLREKFYNIIAGSFAHHEDDYPDVNIAADDCVEIVKEFLSYLGH